MTVQTASKDADAGKGREDSTSPIESSAAHLLLLCADGHCMAPDAGSSTHASALRQCLAKQRTLVAGQHLVGRHLS